MLKKNFLNHFFVLAIIIFIGLILIFSQKISANNSSALIYSTIKISVCGNNIKEGGEQCDGTDLGGATCQSLGYTGGVLSCNPACEYNTLNCITAKGGGGGGGGGVMLPTETKVVLQGKAYPLAKITILKDGQTAKLIKADENANFKTEITDISPGIWNFSLWAEDKYGRKSIIISFSVTILEGKITIISNIFLPPTIELERTNLPKGEELKIFGQTAPNSKVDIHIESTQEIIKTTKAEKMGDWKYLLNTSILDEGMHTTRAKVETLDGLKSSFSSPLVFYVGKPKKEEFCPKADFNKDGKTNLIDFSILLYWLGKQNKCVDQNKDGIVNLSDFSILLYYWTG